MEKFSDGILILLSKWLLRYTILTLQWYARYGDFFRYSLPLPSASLSFGSRHFALSCSFVGMRRGLVLSAFFSSKLFPPCFADVAAAAPSWRSFLHIHAPKSPPRLMFLNFKRVHARDRVSFRSRIVELYKKTKSGELTLKYCRMYIIVKYTRAKWSGSFFFLSCPSTSRTRIFGYLRSTSSERNVSFLENFSYFSILTLLRRFCKFRSGITT